VDVWDLTSGRLLHAFRCDCGADGVSLSHDGRLAVFGTNDAHVLVWNVTTERLLLDRTLSTVRGDHAYGSAARTDGAIVAAGTASGTVVLLDGRSGKTLNRLRLGRNPGPVVRLDLTDDGDDLLVEQQPNDSNYRRGRLDRWVVTGF